MRVLWHWPNMSYRYGIATSDLCALVLLCFSQSWLDDHSPLTEMKVPAMDLTKTLTVHLTQGRAWVQQLYQQA